MASPAWKASSGTSGQAGLALSAARTCAALQY
jgi:hypothetical protein